MPILSKGLSDPLPQLFVQSLILLHSFLSEIEIANWLKLTYLKPLLVDDTSQT